MAQSADEVIRLLKSRSDPIIVDGMARFGINTDRTLGISVGELRKFAKSIGTNHALALQLWRSGLHEARLLASYIDDPYQVNEDQVEAWASDFDSWDVCDQVCGLFEATPFAYRKVREWSSRPEEFVKRAAFAILAGMAVHDQAAEDKVFEEFLPIIAAQANDDRNFVRKSVNWALRNIGKRNRHLNRSAIVWAQRIADMESRSARWIGKDALRELTAAKTIARLKE
jgi:3-methyladenine DNA glycosylase AlkD